MTKRLTELQYHRLHAAVLKQIYGHKKITPEQYDAAFGIVDCMLVVLEKQGHIVLDR